jgi:hypothetical protein
LGKLLKSIATSASFSFFLFCLGCGSGSEPTPNITQVLPQTITAGSTTMTLKVTGTHFPAQATILWNGTELATTVVDANTLSSTVGSSNLANPATVQLKVRNALTLQESPATQITIAQPNTAPPSALTLSIATLPQGVAGGSYNGSFSATGGTAPYNWSVVSGQLPPGLSVAATTGVISGIPTSAGSYSFRIKVADSSSLAQSATTTVSVPVIAAPATPTPLTINSSSLPSGAIGSAYSTVLQASGGTAPYTWSVQGGLPVGLSIAPATGLISGTPTASVANSFTVTVKDGASPPQRASVKFSIAIAAPAPAPAQLSVSTSSLPSGTMGKSYSSGLQAAGGTSPYTWSIISGALAAGLTLGSTGQVSGTPTASGNFSIGVTVKDAGSPAQTSTATLALSIAAAVPLAISTTSLSGGIANESFSASLNATGGTAPYTWSVTKGALPAGLSLAAATGTLAGMPTTAGTASPTFTVKDSSIPVQSKSIILPLTIAAPALTINATLASATAGTAYSSPLAATGGTPAYTWSIANGSSLPAGLTLAATTGIISGTPTASGNFSIGVTVKDAGSPAQTSTATLALSIAAAVPLAISTTSLSGGIANESFSASLNATGGTAPYTWSVTKGALPAGLSLAAATGTLAGMPTTAGTASPTFTVKDSSIPVQSKSIILPLTIAAPALTINATLASATAGTAYSSPLAATGGTPAYTWSIANGSSLPAGLTLAATTGIISGTPSTSGTFNFNVAVSDNGIPVQTASAAASIVVAPAPPPPGPGTTWYVRPDGGTRYSTLNTTGQCDGKADVPYGGTGTNQHCAFGDVRWLWQDGTYSTAGYFPTWGWVIAGGDTVIIRGSIGTGVSWRVGWNNGGGAYDSTTGLYFGLQGDPYNSGIPAPPSGTALQHTRILGENYAACTAQSARTQLHGGWSVFNVINLAGASYVDVGCVDITDFSNCGRDNDAVGCSDGYQDFARYGISFSNQSTNDTLTDVRIHGMALDGIFGPTGDGFVGRDLAIVGNADAGWNADAGDGTTGVGSFSVSNYEISWNGCVEEYPIVDAVPYFSCRDQSTGGYGDGFGTASVNSPAPGWQVNFDNGVVAYNTQDGLDALHVGGTGSTMTITRTLAYGSEGQQFKAGDGALATIRNNVIVGNCEAIPTTTIPGRPVPTQDNLGDWCRAGNTAVLMNVIPGHPAAYQNNTMFSENSVGLEVEYATSDTGPTNTLSYNNNVFVGFYNAANQSNATPIYSSGDLKMLTNPGASWTNNATFGGRSNWGCPASGESNAICTDPGLVDETYHSYGYGNMAPASGTSAVVGAGVALPSILLDYTGTTRSNPPSIGAYEKPSGP